MKSSRQTRSRSRGAQEPPLLSEHLACSLKRHAKRHRNVVRKCRERCSAKSVHALRIEVRRLLAHLDLLRPLAPNPALTSARRGLKRQMKATAALRDAHVQARFFAGLSANGAHADLAPFGDYLKKRKRRLTRTTAKKLKAGKIERALERVGKRVQRFPASEAVDARHRAALGRVLGRAHARIKARNRSAALDPAALHRARVALKKFRYMVELLQPAVPGTDEEKIRQLHELQSVLGEIHDLELFLARLAKFAAKAKLNEKQVRPLRTALMRRHAALVRQQQRLPQDLLRGTWSKILPLMRPPPKPR